MLPLDIHIEGQKVEILPEWRAKIEAELGRLQKHYSGPILHARVEIIGTAHHHLGTFEVHLVVTVPGDVISIIRPGEFVVPL
ncbi:MAG: HPF/RaiA family ribosome-associated protein [Deltaproteobacteria bacterium]|nr:HPF/RaiA family ribosome-associated protein [Deltaproteobacteria bacterium]